MLLRHTSPEVVERQALTVNPAKTCPWTWLRNYLHERRVEAIGSALPIGEWAHVAATFDGTTARFYLNGAMTGQGAFSFATDLTASTHFGCSNMNGGNPFNGALDEVRLYDVALSAAEILQLMGK